VPHIVVSPTIGTAQLLAAIRKEVDECDAEYIAVHLEGYELDVPEQCIQRMVQTADSMDCALVYSDYRVRNADGSLTNHPLAAYQNGSLRDDFDFGPLMLMNANALFQKFKVGKDISPRAGEKPEESEFSGLYACRLFLHGHFGQNNIVHIPEYLYTSSEIDLRKSGEKQFDYVNPRNANVQKEREQVFTQFLRNVNAMLLPVDRTIDYSHSDFKLEAFATVSAQLPMLLNQHSRRLPTLISTLSWLTITQPTAPPKSLLNWPQRTVGWSTLFRSAPT
jgi:hypothetical protein